MKKDIALTCESCAHMRPRRPKDIKVEGGHNLDRHWCQKNDMPTTPGALRCGGDDYEHRKPHQITLAEKLDSLRINGWKPANLAGVWISTENPNAHSPMVKVILLDGRVFEGTLAPEERVQI